MRRDTSEWVFHSTDDPNACVIDFKVTFEVASFLHANAIQLFFDDVAVAQLSAFVERARRVYGARTAAAAQSQPQSQAKAATQPPPESQGESTYPIPSALTGSSRWSTLPVTHAAATTATSPVPPTGAGVATLSHLSGLTAAQRAAESVKTTMPEQHFHDLGDLFARFAVDNGKMYLSGFEQACRTLSGEYQDFRAVTEQSSALTGAVFSSLGNSEQPKAWLTLDEFVVGVYLVTRGTIEEKAQSLFHAIDTLCDGKISREELTTAMQRRIRTVKKIFPMLLHDQVALQMQHENVTALDADSDAAMSSAVASMEALMEEIEKEIPLAVNQIFQEADLNQDDFITQDEWLYAWQTHPEFVELMTIDGMKKFAQWASVVHADDGDADALDTRLTHVD